MATRSTREAAAAGNATTAPVFQPDRAAAPIATSERIDGGRAADSADYAVGWSPSPDFFTRHPKLNALFSPGAGVDRLLADPGLPPG